MYLSSTLCYHCHWTCGTVSLCLLHLCCSPKMFHSKTGQKTFLSLTVSPLVTLIAELGLCLGRSCNNGSPANSSSSDGRFSAVFSEPANAPPLNLSWLDTELLLSVLGLCPWYTMSLSSGLVANILIASWLSSLVTPPRSPVSELSQSLCL